MKLDRNTNPEGRGKYAIINMRVLRKRTTEEIGTESVGISEIIDHGKEVPFFVIKYSDPFAVPALRAYAQAVRDYANQRHQDALDFGSGDETANSEAGEMSEWADEIEREVILAERTTKKLPD